MDTSVPFQLFNFLARKYEVNERVKKNYLKYVSEPICDKLIKVIDADRQLSPNKNKENTNKENEANGANLSSLKNLVNKTLVYKKPHFDSQPEVRLNSSTNFESNRGKRRATTTNMKLGFRPSTTSNVRRKTYAQGSKVEYLGVNITQSVTKKNLRMSSANSKLQKLKNAHSQLRQSSNQTKYNLSMPLSLT